MAIAITIQTGMTAEKFLQQSFNRKVTYGCFDYGETKIHTAVIPDLYHLTSAHSMPMLQLRHLFGQPLRWHAAPIQGIGDTRESCAEDLANQLIQLGAEGRLSELIRQPSQERSPIVLGHAYRSVHNHEKEHSHSDPRLANLVDVIFSPFSGFVRCTLDDNHAHLHLGS